MYYEKDADPTLIRSKKVAIIGYGSQGHAHALNLKDSGVQVVVGLREGSSSKAKAEAAGLTVKSIADAAKWADVVMLTMPDTEQKQTYSESIKRYMKPGKALAFAHGFNIRFKRNPSAEGRRHHHDRAEGPGSPGAPHLHRGRRRAVPHRGGAGRNRPGKGPRTVVCRGNRWRTFGRHRDHLHRRRPRPTCSASRPSCAAALPRWCRRAS